MPYHDEEYPGQTLWQSVLLFCCKGMIEGIMVLLFLWLLIQVLFSKQLEVHLQILLLVGLVVFCLCLILGCVLCWRSTQVCPPEDKGRMPSPSAPADLVILPQSPPPSAVFTTRQQYEELDGDILDYPSTFSSPTPSDDNFSTMPFSRHSHSTSDHKEHPKSYFPLRRLSTPSISKAAHRYTSYRSLPKLGLLARVLERRCTVAGDSFSHSERSRLTSSSTGSPSLTEEPIPLSTLHYGSSCRQPTPTLHFTMAFSPEEGSLTITVLSLTGTFHRLAEVSVMGSLAPLYPCPLLASARCSASPNPSPTLEPQSLGLVLKMGSVEELQRCVLRLVVYSRDFPSLRGSPLGELEVQCGGKDWKPDHPLHCTQELSAKKWTLKKSLTSQDASSSRGSPQVLGQLFILLQYQNLTHRIKAMVLRADNLANLSHTLGEPDYQVVVNLRHHGVLIGTGETNVVGGANTVWNTPFLFDLPPSDVTQLPLMLEFIVLQDQAHSKSRVLGRVLIGTEAPEAGRAHWRDVCGQGQVERARWHIVQPELL